MKRLCVCGEKIPHNAQLCAGCISIYGSSAGKWPVWLQEWMKACQRELNAERDHPCISLDALMVDRLAPPLKRLNGCRDETHLWQDRHNHGG